VTRHEVVPGVVGRGRSVALVGYLIYVLVTGNGPRRLIAGSLGTFIGTIVVFGALAGGLALVIR
jgi:hypothetical protein